jgi:putative transposase
MKKIPPSEKIRKELKELLTRGSEGEGVLNEFLRKGMQLLMQELLEAETADFLDRGHYERRGDGSRQGLRNGYKARCVKTAEGVVPYELPQVREIEEPYRSKLRVFFKGNTDCLQKLTAEMYARGLSTRDIEDALIEATGDMLLSKSSVSRVTEILWEEYEQFQQRNLSCFEVEYLFLDAVYESIRKLWGIKEAILAAWGIQRDGSKVLLSFSLGNKESYHD